MSARCGGSPGTGKPRRASGTAARQRVDGATDADADQGLEVAAAGMPENDEGARSDGDVTSAAHAGKALEGWHRRGGTRPSEGRRETGCTRHGAGRNPMNPMVGSRMQQACDRPGGGSRRGGEKPRGRNTHGAWQHRAEADAGPRETPSGNEHDGGANFENPKVGVRSRPGDTRCVRELGRDEDRQVPSTSVRRTPEGPGLDTDPARRGRLEAVDEGQQVDQTHRRSGEGPQTNTTKPPRRAPTRASGQ